MIHSETLKVTLVKGGTTQEIPVQDICSITTPLYAGGSDPASYGTKIYYARHKDTRTSCAHVEGTPHSLLDRYNELTQRRMVEFELPESQQQRSNYPGNKREMVIFVLPNVAQRELAAVGKTDSTFTYPGGEKGFLPGKPADVVSRISAATALRAG